MKLLVRLIAARQKIEVSVCEQQYGFMPKMCITDAILALRILIEKYREPEEQNWVFVNLEKHNDRVPRKGIWF